MCALFFFFVTTVLVVVEGLSTRLAKNEELIQFYTIFFLKASEELLKQHYIDLKDRPFYPGLVKYMNSGPIVAMVSIHF